MGQKTNPTGFRLAVRRNWQSRWFARKKDFAKLLHEDQVIRSTLMEKLKQASVPRIFIERAGALDEDARHRSLLEFFHQRGADDLVLMEELGEILLAREPARLPVAANGEAETCRVGLLSHGSRLVGFAVGEDDAEVRHALDARLGRALGAGLEALEDRAGFNEGAVHGERAGRQAVVVLRVRHGALERLDEEAGRLARDEREEVDGLGHGTALDLVRDFADLARGHTRVAGESLNFHCSIPIRRTSQISLRVMPPCALKIRVGANSPSLWPTMFSVTYTAMCALPL